MLSILRAIQRTGRVTTGYPDRPNPTDDAGCRGRPVVDPALCDGAGDCARACPTEAISLAPAASGANGWRLDLARCLFCGLCAEACARGAIRMSESSTLAARTRAELVVEAGPNPPAPLRRGEKGETAPFGRLRRSLHIRHMAAGSENACDWEISALLNPVYDVQRLGIDFVASPRHADLLLVTGAVTRNLEPALLATYEAMPAPRIVVAVGDEACSGGILRGSYACAGGVDRGLPGDVYVPGDPPRPQALIEGLLIAAGKL